jgi:microcystin-dependent protein
VGSITGFNADRLQQIENTTVTSGRVNEMGNLLLATREGVDIDAGYVRGATGVIGPDRPQIAGVISIFGGSTPPSGWLFCDGAAVSRNTYSELFAAIGTTFGVGDGAATFNLPDFKGRVAAGLDINQTEFDTLGEKGGEKTHLLTTAEIPSHTHTIKGYSGVDDLNFTGLNGAFAASDAVTPFDQQTQGTGGGLPHNNLQPYTTVNYIISVGNAGTPVAPPENYVGRGTTAERDNIFGVPSTDPQRVALANRKIIWFNTDTGWEEMYYAATGKAGLTALGLVAQATSGWYPTGPGPAMLWEPTGNNMTPTTGAFVGGWGWTRKRGGSAWWDSPDGKLVKIKRYGRYEARAWTVQQTGTGTMNYHLRTVAADATTIVRNVDGNAFPLNGSLYTRAHMEQDDTILEPNQHIGMWLASGNAGIHYGALAPQGQLSVRYLGPPLVLE